MAELKTKENSASVAKFIASVADETTRKDCQALCKMMKRITKKDPKMWGTAIIGFGSYHYKYASGHEGDSCLLGFSPRKNNISIYAMGIKKYEDLLKKLGKHKLGGGCLYIKKLDDVEESVLIKILTEAYKNNKANKGV